MTRAFALAFLPAALLLGASCGGKGPEPGATTTAPTVAAPKAADLEAFAPAEITASLVIDDRVLDRVDFLLAEIRRLVDTAMPGHTAELDAMVATTLGLPAGFSIMDTQTWSQAGIDVGMGAAIYLRPDSGLVAVLSLRDRPTFVKFFAGTRDGEVDAFGAFRCQPKSGRYVCASPGDLLAKVSPQAPQGDPGSGDIHVVFRPNADIKGLMSQLLGLPTDFDSAQLDIELGQGVATARATIATRASAGWLQARRRQAPPQLTAVEARPGSLLRLRMPPDGLRALPWPKMGPLDLGEVLAPELTGDFAVVSSADEPLTTHSVAGLAHSAPVSVALRTGCRLAGFAGLGSFSFRGERCEGRLNSKKLGAPPAVMRWLPATVPTFLQVHDRAAVVSLGGAPRAGEPDGFGNPVTRRLASSDWNLVVWGRWTDPELVLEPAAFGQLRQHLSQMMPAGVMAANRALLANVYDGGIGVRATDEGLVVEAGITTFAADGPEVYGKYSAALAKLAKGDTAGYRSDVQAIAAAHPSSLVARMAGARAFPIAPLAGVGALLGLSHDPTHL